MHGATKELEHEIKISRIKNALFKVGLEYPIEDIVQHTHPFGYRQKVKLIVQIIEGNLRLGVYVPYTHQFVLAEKCPYVRPEINEGNLKILEVLNGSAFETDRTLVKAIIMRLGRNGLCAVLVVNAKLSKRAFQSLETVVNNGTFLSVVERVQDQETNSVLAGEITRRIGPPLIEPLEGGPNVDPDSFCQTDPHQANVMYQVVADFLTEQGSNGIFVDAYAGTGGFSRALLQNGCHNIVAIEQSLNSLSTLNKLGVTVIQKPMAEALKNLVSLGPLAGMVVDPPKKGLAEDKKTIAELNIKRFALISCDPDAMAQDVKELLKHGYEVRRIIPIDFFGGTPNIETVVLLRGLPK